MPQIVEIDDTDDEDELMNTVVRMSLNETVDRKEHGFERMLQESAANMSIAAAGNYIVRMKDIRNCLN